MKDSRLTLKNYVLLICAILAFSLATVACKTVPENVPDDDREIAQLAQGAYDSGNWKLAINYYKAMLDKYGDNPKIYVEANFEIAHIYIKKKKYNEAVPMLEEILDLYNNVAPGTLPGEFRKLSQLDMAKVPAEKLEAIHKASKTEEEPITDTETSSDTTSQ